MVINYRKSQKTILRVNPRVPLHELLPAICEKCEFDTETTVLLRDVTSLAPLDLSNTLNDYAIREVYAKDTKSEYQCNPSNIQCFYCAWPAYRFEPRSESHLLCTKSQVCLLCRTSCCSGALELATLFRYFIKANPVVCFPPGYWSFMFSRLTCFFVVFTFIGAVTPSKDKNQKEKENKGLFSMFRKSKKKAEQVNVNKYLTVTFLGQIGSFTAFYILNRAFLALVCHWLKFTVLCGNMLLIVFWLDVCSLKPTTASAPASPVLVSKPRPLSVALPISDSASLGSSMFSDVPKKRRAPQPPVLVSHSFRSDFGARRRLHSEPNPLPDDQVSGLWKSEALLSLITCIILCICFGFK